MLSTNFVCTDDLYNSLRAQYYLNINLNKFQEYKEEIYLHLIHVVVEHEWAVNEYCDLKISAHSTCWLEMEDDTHPWSHISVNTQHMKTLGKLFQSDQPVII